MHPHIDRVQPVDKDFNDEQKQDQKRKKVFYQGRAWVESEDELAYEPVIPAGNPEKGKRKGMGMCTDILLFERAEKLYHQLTTLEEKVAQICFIQTQSTYDPTTQQESEKLIQVWQIGGILFSEGNYKRQAYLVEHYQNLSKTPLLIGNDFIHGLNLYFQHDHPINFENDGSEHRFSDIGKALMVQNRQLGIHFQFDSEREKMSRMNPAQIRAFRKGIRYAHGIVGRSHGNVPLIVEKSKLTIPFSINQKVGAKEVESIVQEATGIKTLNFLDMSRDLEIDEKKLISAFNKQYEVFLFSHESLSQGVRVICHAVRSGLISEEEIDRRVMKLLIIKSRLVRQSQS